jgi:hypothetical protein
MPLGMRSFEIGRFRAGMFKELLRATPNVALFDTCSKRTRRVLAFRAPSQMAASLALEAVALLRHAGQVKELRAKSYCSP